MTSYFPNFEATGSNPVGDTIFSKSLVILYDEKTAATPTAFYTENALRAFYRRKELRMDIRR